MNLFYAMGGGFGHLYRISILIKQFKITACKVVTTNPLAFKLFKAQNILLFSADNYLDEWNEWKREQLPKFSINAVFIDVFPAGILGENIDLNIFDCPVYYLARRMRWQIYKEKVKNFEGEFEKVFLLEELEEDHLSFIKCHTKTFEFIKLNYPDPEPQGVFSMLSGVKKPLWLITHAFDSDELVELIQYAKQAAELENVKPFFVIVSDQKVELENGIYLDYTPASNFFPLADRIFSGAGFNSVQQLLPYKSIVTLLPFPRKYDNQAWRIAHNGFNLA